MKILINGAAGYVGGKLVGLLHGRHKIVACDIQSGNLDQSSIEKNIVSPETRIPEWAALCKGCDVVVNLAQYPDYKAFPEKAEDIFNANTRLPLRLLEAARLAGVKSFILFSSGGIYGSGKEKFHELDNLNPLDFYLATKAMSELIARKYRQYLGVHIVRPFFIYGPGQEEKLISNIIRNIIAGKPVHLNGDGDGGRINPIYIDDVLFLTESLLNVILGSTTTNFAGPDIVSIRDIITGVSSLTGKKAIVEHRKSEPTCDIIADIGRIREISNITLTPFQTGLAKTVGFYKNLSALTSQSPNNQCAE